MHDDEFDEDTPQNLEEELEAQQADEAIDLEDGLGDESTVIPEGWLPFKQYGAKYGILSGRVKWLMKSGRLIHKTFGADGHIRLKRICVLDVPLDQHPTTDQDNLPTAPTPKGKYRQKKKAPAKVATDLEAKRKKNLRDKYLPKFIENAPPERMTFTAAELLKIFGITQPIFHRDWKKWGLVGRKAPEEYKHLSGGVRIGAGDIYTRRDVVRFLQGEWERSEDGGTPDDILIGATEGVKALDGMYFNYDRANIYPFDAEGFFGWLEEVGLMVENKRLRKWVPYKLWSVQKEAVKGILEVDKKGDFTHKIGILCWPRGEGKSLAKSSKVLSFSGKMVKVEDVKVGDLLMGPDSTPRKVLALGRGEEEMFEVTPMRGEPFICNRSHILALKYRKEVYAGFKNGKKIRRQEIHDIRMHLDDYLKQGVDFRGRCMLYRVPIDWVEKLVDLDPYFLGLWLGDGTSKEPSVTTADKEVVRYLAGVAKSFNLRLIKKAQPNNKSSVYLLSNGNGRKGNHRGCPNPVKELLRKYGVLHNKHIPFEYKTTSREVRLRLLAGLIDSDGYRNRNSIQFTMKSRQLVDDIAFIARSLGFHAEIKETQKGIKSTGFVGTYYCLGISGDCSIIPNLISRKKCAPRKHNKNILWSGIKNIESKGMGEYYGFVLDGDHLFLLEDFTVTHNTLLVCVLTLFFFFNGYSETITLAGNTRDQSKFTHYDLCKGIVQHTPKLRKTPGLEIKEKHIALKTGPKEMFSYMQAVPTSVGLLPGTTRAVFTELHNLQDTKFFYDLWTSLRNVPNAMVLVDTTVARPGHLVHNLWQTYTKGEDPKIFFHHYADKHYNPEMTIEELNHFRQNMPEVLFSMYFRNRWEDAAGSLFPTEKVREMSVCGLDGAPGVPTPELTNAVKQIRELEITRNSYVKGKVDLLAVNREIAAIEQRLYPVVRLYKMPATREALEKIGKVYGCNFVIGVGLDRAQRHSKHYGRTVMSCVARGALSAETSLYFVLDIFIPTESTLPVLAEKFLEWSREYGWIDKVAVETYSSQDFYDWVSDKALAAEFCTPSFQKQKPVFFTMSNIVDNGYLKCPPVPYYTDEDGKLYRGFTNKEDVFMEELDMFNYIPGVTEKTGTFGSPEKNKKSGVQDDTVYSVAWAIYATHGEDLVPAHRGGGSGIIAAIVNSDVVGDYH